MSILLIFFPSAEPAQLLSASQLSLRLLHKPSHFTTQIPAFMLCFCMSAFTYHAFLKFHFLSWTPGFFHRPVRSRNTVMASYSLGLGEPGAGSNADALASCFHPVGTEHGRESQGLLTSNNIPGRVRGEPGLGSSHKNTKQNRLERASLWGSLPGRRPQPICHQAGLVVRGASLACGLCSFTLLMQKPLYYSCLNSQIIFSSN